MRRALATFQAAGINTIPASTDFEVVEREARTVLDWLPDAEALEGTTRALKEYLGVVVYRLRKWLSTRYAGGRTAEVARLDAEGKDAQRKSAL